MTSYYRIQSNRFLFYARIQKDTDDGSLEIHIGSKRRPVCVLITLNGPTSTKAILQGVSYDERCASNEPMPKKIGSRAMLMGAIAFLKTTFPTLKYLSLTDEMFFECEGKRVATANMSFILNGSTWYERYFNAEPVSKAIYDELKYHYTTQPLQDVSFHRIWNDSLSLTRIPKKEARKIYEGSSTWKDFYSDIYKHYNCEPFVAISAYKPFVLFYDKLPTLVSMIWYIPIETTSLTLSNIRIEALSMSEFPEMDWKPLEKNILRHRRMFGGGLIKHRRKYRMYLGEGVEVLKYET